MESRASPGSCSPEAARTLAPRQLSEYSAELLQRDGMEWSFEELRAQLFHQSRQLVLHEKLQQLQMAKESLSSELEEKKKLLHQRLTQGAGQPPCEAGFQVYDESETPPPASGGGSQLLDDVFLRPGETGLAVRVQYPDPGCLVVSDQKQGGPIVQVQSPSEDRLWPAEAAPPAANQTPSVSQKPPKSRKHLSPIEEAGDFSSLADPAVEAPGPPGDANDSALRLRLLERSEARSCPDLHSERGPAPAVEEHSHLLLGDSSFWVRSRLLEHDRFSVYGAAAPESRAIIKVDKCSSLWDFHMIQRLKTTSSSAEALPEISCYQFEDGCITVYSAPPSHDISVLQECVTGEESLQKLVPPLLRLLCLLQSCGLIHGGLQPGVLACLSSHAPQATWLFPLEWSLSVDLHLQRDVVSLQQLPAAQIYISQGVLDPRSSPHQLDQMGVAQTVHLFLTGGQMVPVRDDDGWTARGFKEDSSDDFHARWRLLFRTLLSGGASEILESFTF